MKPMTAKVEEKPDGAPEWMVSYADMITIMMSFFVIMFALAAGQAAKGKANQKQQAAMESLQYRFGPKYQPFSNWGVNPGNSLIPSAGKAGTGKRVIVANTEEGTIRALKQERARIRIAGQGERIVIGGVVFFNESSLDLAQKQKNWLQTIASEMVGKPQQVEIVGHSSTRPLPSGSPYKDRWDLTYARCRHAAQMLGTMKIDPSRIRITVMPTNEMPPPADRPASQSEESRIDVYLTDKFADNGVPKP